MTALMIGFFYRLVSESKSSNVLALESDLAGHNLKEACFETSLVLKGCLLSFGMRRLLSICSLFDPSLGIQSLTF